MPEIVFKVLCANDSDSCDRVRQIMRDMNFRVDDRHKGRDFDHIGIKNYDSVLEAKKEEKEIAEIAGLDVLRIKLRSSL